MINPASAPARFRSILQLEIDPADLYRVKATTDRNRLKSDGTDSQLWCPKEPSGSVIGP